MTKKLKLPLGILTVLAVFLAALLFLPLGATDGFAITASAEGEEHTCIGSTAQSNGDGTHNLKCDCGETFESNIVCNNYDNGYCIECGYECPHNWDSGVCTICGKECSHSEFLGGKCTVCGIPEPVAKEATSSEEAISAIQSALINRQNIKLTLSGEALANITTENCGEIAQKIYNSAIKHITDTNNANRSQLGDYIAKSVGGNSVSITGSTNESGGLNSVTYTYIIDYYTTSKQEQAVTNTLGNIYSTLNLSKCSTDLEKVYKIYNWIVNNVSYDYEGLEAGTSKTMYTAYGALHDGKAVCQGFAALFYRMCLDNGIDCRIVTGTSKGENHAWNIVKVGDKYYYADPTWDCFVIEDTENSRQAKPGTFFYFLRGTLANHTESAEENVTNGYTMAGAEEYLSAFKAGVVDGKATAVHLDGTPLSDAEKTWYDVAAEGESCPVTITVKGSSGIVSDNDLAGLELLSAVMEHNFGEDGFCTVCDSGYQPATLNNGVYEIGNAGQLYWFAQQVNGGKTGINAVLTANITVNKNVLVEGALNTSESANFRSWTPISNYTGTFDGAGHTISGLYFNVINGCAVGLFGSISTGGTVKNVGVVDSYISGAADVGGVCGRNSGGTIKNCYNEGSVSGWTSVGGVCGSNNGGKIENCYNTGAIIGTYDTENGLDAQNAGGVCGANSGTIQNCHNTGSVSGQSFVGGVCGINSGTIKNSYNTGSVSGDASVGGVCGWNDGIIQNCYFDSEVYRGNDVGTNEGGTVSDNVLGKITDDFKSGEVAYLLQSGQTEDENGTIPEVWGQNIDNTEPKQDYPVLGGAKVYQTTPCPSYSNDPTKEHKDDNGDEICDVCEEYVDGIGAVAGHSLSLSGNIGVKFFMLLSKDIEYSETAYMQFTLPNGTTEKVLVSSAERDTTKVPDRTCYVFTCEVAAKEMTDTITAQMFDGNGNSGKQHTYTVKEYADYIIANSSDTDTVALVKAMLNYGAYSQLYFNNSVDKLANAEIDVALSSITAANLSSFASSYNNNESYTGSTSYYGSSLVLKSETDIKHYFKPAVGIESYTCKDSNGNSYEVVASGSYIYVRVPNILAHRLGDKITLTLYENGIAVGTISYSPMSYAYAVLSKYPKAGEKDTLRNVVIALYDYYTKAKAYRVA